ncbi:MAG: hypothetical protein WC861_06710 [Candidatus Micrarchaeia archaeon]|jgi:hypothetical protein
MADAKNIALAALLFLALSAPGFCSVPLQPGSTVLSVAFTSIDGTPLAGEKVTFTLGGRSVSSYTDAGGVVSIGVDSSGEVLAYVKKNDYNYTFSFNVVADGIPKSEKAALAPLLRIEYFGAKSDGPSCYILSANASDPRQNRPISIRMLLVNNGGTPAGEIRVALDESYMYAGRVCAGADMSVKVIASNTYETVEKTIPLAQAEGQPQPPVAAPPQPPAAPPILPKPNVEPSPIEGLGAILVGIAILAVVLGAAVMVLGRSSPAGNMAKSFSRAWGMVVGSSVRPIVEYLRSLVRKKPPTIPFGQQPPKGPMMPIG